MTVAGIKKAPRGKMKLLVSRRREESTCAIGAISEVKSGDLRATAGRYLPMHCASMIGQEIAFVRMVLRSRVSHGSESRIKLPSRGQTSTQRGLDRLGRTPLGQPHRPCGAPCPGSLIPPVRSRNGEHARGRAVDPVGQTPTLVNRRFYARLRSCRSRT